MSDASFGPDGAVVVRFELDPRGLQDGAKKAGDALDDVKGKAQSTQKGISAAFQTSAGTIQIAQGIAQTATSFDKLNVAAGTFSASRVLLEIGNTARDFNQFRAGIQGATTAFGALGLVISANPIGAIATAIGLAATAMTLFGDSTKKAATEWERLADASRKTSVNASIDDFLGLGMQASGGTRLSDIKSALASLAEDRTTPITGADVRNRLGFNSSFDAMTGLAGVGNVQAQKFLSGNGGAFLDPSQLSVSRAEFQQLARRQFDDIQEQIDREKNQYQFGAIAPPPARKAFPFTDNSIGPNDYVTRAPGSGGSGGAIASTSLGVSGSPYAYGTLGAGMFPSQIRQDYVSQSASDQLRVHEEQQKAIEESQRAMKELVDSAHQFGAVMGDAFFNVASGTQTARQAIAGIVADLARAASQQAFASLAGSIARGFGTTPAQQGGVGLVLPP